MDLMAFSDNTLCRTVALLAVPIIASVGHHTDRTLLDDARPRRIRHRPMPPRQRCRPPRAKPSRHSEVSCWRSSPAAETGRRPRAATAVARRLPSTPSIPLRAAAWIRTDREAIGRAGGQARATRRARHAPGSMTGR
jgi:hypothetical protein